MLARKLTTFFVNFAECASPALKEFDALYKDQGKSDVIGELENEFQADERDEIFLSKFDGQVLTLLRFCAKALHEVLMRKVAVLVILVHIVEIRMRRRILYRLEEIDLI